MTSWIVLKPVCLMTQLLWRQTIPFSYFIACAFHSNCMGPKISSGDHTHIISYHGLP